MSLNKRQIITWNNFELHENALSTRKHTHLKLWLQEQSYGLLTSNMKIAFDSFQFTNLFHAEIVKIGRKFVEKSHFE